jgi:hypothetical protein
MAQIKGAIEKLKEALALRGGGVDADLAKMRDDLGPILSHSKKTASGQSAISKPIMQAPRNYEFPPQRWDPEKTSQSFSSIRGGSIRGGLTDLLSYPRVHSQSKLPPPHSQSLLQGGQAMASRGAAAPAISQPDIFTRSVPSVRIGTWDAGKCTLMCTKEKISWVAHRPLPGTNEKEVSMQAASIRDVIVNVKSTAIKMAGTLWPEDINENESVLDFFDLMSGSGVIHSRKERFPASHHEARTALLIKHSPVCRCFR